MSIADKLTAIAENQKAVYDAGFSAGQAQGGGSGDYNEGWNDGWQSGYDEGWNEGYDVGYGDGGLDAGGVDYDSAFNEGYDAGHMDGRQEGEQTGQDAMWDNLQNEGKRTDYRYAFYYGAYTHIDPKWNINASNADNMFGVCNNLQSVNWDKFNLSAVSSMYNAFGLCPWLTEVDTDLCVVNGTATLMNSIFRNCYKLQRVKKLTAYPSAVWKDSFAGCYELTHIIFDGTIGANGLNMKDCTKLDKESITSIINALSDTTSGLSITLSYDAVCGAWDSDEFGPTFDSGWYELRNTKSNWTITLV